LDMPTRISPVLILLILSIAIVAGLACQSAALKTPRAEAETHRSSTPARSADTINIAAVGDIMMGSTSINDTFLPPNDGRDMLKEVTPVLSAADIAMGNLEGPLVEGGKSEKCPDVKPGQPAHCFAFRVPTRYGRYLKDAGFDIFNLANNHASD